MLEIANEDFVKLVKFIKDRYGLNLEDRKILVESRLSNYVLDCGFDNFSDYLRLVYNDSTQREVANMINRLTTNHTYFMRETAHFQHMMGIFLPYAEKNVKDKTLSIWSAGCSYGNEPYNIAMCLDEYFGEQGKQWDLKILATDISYNALKSASNGVFSPAAIENVPDRWREKYFTHTQFGDYKVIDEIRSNVVFRYHNLMDDIVFKRKFHLIFISTTRQEQSCVKSFTTPQSRGDISTQGTPRAYPMICHTNVYLPPFTERWWRADDKGKRENTYHC